MGHYVIGRMAERMANPGNDLSGSILDEIEEESIHFLCDCPVIEKRGLQCLFII